MYRSIIHISKSFLLVVLCSSVSACSFTTLGKYTGLGLEGDDIAPYKYNIRHGFGDGNNAAPIYFFENEQSIYQIELSRRLFSLVEISGIFFIIPLVYLPGGIEYDCTDEEIFSFWITETIKQPDILFQDLSVEHFVFYDNETEQSFKAMLVEATDTIVFENDIYHKPTDTYYRGADLFANKQSYQNYIEFSIDEVSCGTVTADDKLIIHKPPYIDVSFTFAKHGRGFASYIPDWIFTYPNDYYYLEDIKDKIEVSPQEKQHE